MEHVGWFGQASESNITSFPLSFYMSLLSPLVCMLDAYTSPIEYLECIIRELRDNTIIGVDMCLKTSDLNKNRQFTQNVPDRPSASRLWWLQSQN